MTDKIAQLNELIEVTRDGQRFYDHAIEHVKDEQLRSIWRDMAQAKSQVIRALTAVVAANQESPATGGTVIGKLRQVYADTRATLSSDEAATYVAQLEEAEDRILQAFEEALECAEPDVRVVLIAEMPKIRACHERMRTLKHATH